MISKEVEADLSKLLSHVHQVRLLAEKRRLLLLDTIPERTSVSSTFRQCHLRDIRDIEDCITNLNNVELMLM